MSKLLDPTGLSVPFHRTAGDPRVRRNMAMTFTDPQGRQHRADTMDEYLVLVEQFGGGYEAPKKPRKSKKSKKWDVSAEKRAEDPFHPGRRLPSVTLSEALQRTAPLAEKIREHGGRVTHLEALSEMGLNTFGQASDIITAMKDAGVGLRFGKRTDRSKKEARQILSQHGVSCPI